MALEYRDYPDMQFVETDPETIRAEQVALYEKISGRTLYRADPVRLLINWTTLLEVQYAEKLNHTARQNIPRYAEGQNLDRLGELFRDTQRLAPTQARTTFRFTLSKPLDFQQLIPGGTRVTTLDGKVLFTTSEAVYVPAGETTVEVGGFHLADDKKENWEDGNGLLPGQLSVLVDGFPYFEQVTNITESAGGSGWESQEAYYIRMVESAEGYSTAGPSGAYRYHALSASPLISDVRATSTAERPDEVDICVLLHGGRQPTKEIIELVEQAVTADKRRPMTEKVNITGPEAVPFDIDLTYYVPNYSAISTEVIDADVQEAIAEYIEWQTVQIGRDVNPTELIHRIRQAGAKRVELREPHFIVVPEDKVAVLGSAKTVNGGPEDE